MQHCGNAIPMVVMIVPEKKKALARSQLLLNVLLFVGSTPAPMASVTFCKDTKNNSLDGWYVLCLDSNQVHTSLAFLPLAQITVYHSVNMC